MPQEFHVLRCYSCQLFQVHIVKKSSKWQCKVCGEKQSIIKVFGNGTSKECREIVQYCNEHYVDQNEDGLENEASLERSQFFEEVNSPKVSKWSEFTNNVQSTKRKASDDVDTADTNKRKPGAGKNIFEDEDAINLDVLLDI